MNSKARTVKKSNTYRTGNNLLNNAIVNQLFVSNKSKKKTAVKVKSK